VNDAKEYRAIAVWGSYLKSYAYYIQLQQQLAVMESAPLDAIYRDNEYVWVRKSDLHDEHPFHAYMEQLEDAGLI
jgi:hypothetical protein